MAFAAVDQGFGPRTEPDLSSTWLTPRAVIHPNYQAPSVTTEGRTHAASKSPGTKARLSRQGMRTDLRPGLLQLCALPNNFSSLPDEDDAMVACLIEVLHVRKFPATGRFGLYVAINSGAQQLLSL